MGLYRDATGQIVVAPSLPAGGSIISPASSSNLVDKAPWFRSLDSSRNDWHPAKYYGGTGEAETSDSILPYLTKPVLILNADAAGTVASYTLANGNYKVFKGGVDITTSCIFALSNSVGVTATINASGYYAVSSLTLDSGSIDITATYQGVGYTYSLSVIKNRAGAGASTSVINFINTSAPVIAKQAPDAATAGSHVGITINGRKVDGATITDNTGFWITVTANGGTEAVTATPSPYVLSPANGDGKTFYTIRLYNGATVATSTLLDTEVIPVVFSGGQGQSGLDGMTFVLTNDSHTVPTLSDGSSGNFTNSGTDIYVYEGSTQLTYDGVGTSIGTWTVSATGSGATPGSFTDQGAYARISALSAMTLDIAYVSFTISGKRLSGEAFSYIQWQTLSKAKQGAAGSGSNARSVELYTPNQAFTYTAAGSTPSPSTTTVTATPQNTSGTVYYEFSVNGTVIQNTTSATANYTPQASFSNMPQQIVVNIREGASTGAILASDVMTLFGLKPGADGVNGSRTCVLDLYKWASSAPSTFPSGSSTYTWADGTFTLPGTPNGWALTPGSGSPGDTLYICRQPYGDNLTASTSSVTWAATFSVPTGQAGLSGVNGQRVGFLEVYQWSVAQPSPPSGTSTYTWSNGTFTNPSTPNGWALLPGASVPGATLWGSGVGISNTGTSGTDSVSWGTPPVYAVGAAGSDGLTCILSNETHVCPADKDGNVTSYLYSETEIWLYDGATPIQFDGVGTASNTFKVVATPTDITPGAITDLGAQAKVANSSGFTVGADNAKIVFTISGKRNNGQTFSFPKVQTFSKSKQGATGNTGGAGTRGSGMFYTTGSAWDDTVANNKVLSIFSSKVYGDQVTISNGTTYANTKYWNGSAWVSPGQVIDGNLLVTGSVSAVAINANGLSIRDLSGNIILYAGGDAAAMDFARIGGATRPANNATIGADATNLVMGTGGNLLANSDFKAGIANWVADGGIDPIWDLEGTPWQPFGGHSIGIYRPGFPSNATSVSIEITDKLIRSMRYEFSAYLASHRCSCWVAINFHDSSGNFISQASFSRPWTYDNGGPDLNNWYRGGAFFTVPPNMAGARLYLVQDHWINNGFGTASTYAWATKFFLAQAHAGQTELSTWAPGGAGGKFSELDKITVANSEVYIDALTIKTLHIIDGDVSLLRQAYQSKGSSGTWQNFSVNTTPQLVDSSEIYFPYDAYRGTRIVMILDWWPWSVAHNTPIGDRAEWQVQVVRQVGGIDVAVDNFYFETFRCTGGQTDKVTSWSYFNLPTSEFTFLLRATCLTTLGPSGTHRSIHGFSFNMLEFKR